MKYNLQEDVELNKELSLTELIRIFLQHKKVIIYTALTALVISAILLFFVIDPIFMSTATVKVSPKTGGLGDLLAVDNLPDIGDLGEIGGGGAIAKELAFYENILMSRRCLEETIIKFNLLDEYKIEYMQDAVKSFRENIITLDKDRNAGTMEISIYDKNPQKAKEITEFLIQQLNKISIEINVQNSRMNREFIEDRVNIVKNDLRKAEDSLKLYQDLHGLAPDITVKAVAQSEIQLESQIKAEQIKLDLLQKILSPDQAEIKSQENKIQALQSQLYDIQNGIDGSSNLQLKGRPAIVMDYYRLTRDVEIQNKILQYIIPVFEQAKISEKKEMPSVTLLDPPNLPEKKTKPKRLTGVLLSTIASIILVYLFFLIKEKIWIKVKHINQSL